MPRDPQITYKIMSAVKSKETSLEITLGRAMWKLGLRYRKYYKIIGNPDFVLVKAKIAIFCDGDFWHGNNWKIRDKGSLDNELKSYSKFWSDKIQRNILRDNNVNNELSAKGWSVIRFWGSDIVKSPDDCALQVYRIYEEKNKNSPCKRTD